MTAIGAFVEVAGSSDGIGRLAQRHAQSAVVEYFVSPNGPELVRRTVLESTLRPVQLSGQTCVFWHEPQTGLWRRGLVDGEIVPKAVTKADEDQYDIRFPNGVAIRIRQSELFVRWAYPVVDPLDYLVARTTDSPYYFEGRQKLSAHLADQRAALDGMTALASSLIELYPHQISAVRRILADPVQRYLLADEVGLGKTIEAGILIRQHTIDQPRSQVLVVMPDHLHDQWNEELTRRFFPRPSECGVCLATEGSLISNGVPDGEFGMLVVDEAHRAASRAFAGDAKERTLYERLKTLAGQAPAVLLLSGTPVLHQEDGFLAMLHLLDPSTYPLEDRESFRRRVHERTEVAQCVAELSEDAPSMVLEATVDRLEHLFSDDSTLRRRCADVRSTLGSGGPGFSSAVRALRRHVIESYRLHRRMVRTRRDDPRLENLLPKRSGIELVPCDDIARGAAVRFLESWQAQTTTTTQAVSDRFASWVEASLSGPQQLARCIRDRLSSLAELRSHKDSLAFAEEPSVLEAAARDIEEAGHAAKTEALITWLSENAPKKKCIVFVDEPRTAEDVCRDLRRRLGDDVVTWSGDEPVEDDDGQLITPIRSFEEFDARVLVCDRNAEEGTNLQRAATLVVHYDLPMSPQRLEQRIGRTDRLDARRGLRLLCFTPVGAYEERWHKYLDTIGVFRESVAPLQYVLADSVERLRGAFLSAGPEAFEVERRRLADPKTGLAEELRRIRDQDFLDSVEADPTGEEAAISRIEEVDEQARLQSELAFDSWLVDRLFFEKNRRQPAGVDYVYVVGRTRLPLMDVYGRFGPFIDSTDPRRRRDQMPLGPFSFLREDCEESAAELLRVGHPFVTTLEDLLRADDRGAAFALWRAHPTWEGPAALFFRFEFLIEVNLDGSSSDAQPAAREALRRVGIEAFPIQHRTVWLDPPSANMRESPTRSAFTVGATRFIRHEDRDW